MLVGLAVLAVKILPAVRILKWASRPPGASTASRTPACRYWSNGGRASPARLHCRRHVSPPRWLLSTCCAIAASPAY